MSNDRELPTHHEVTKWAIEVNPTKDRRIVGCGIADLQQFAVKAIAWDRANQSRAVVPRLLARNQPCGCVVCLCEDERQCHGCGAKICGTHPHDAIPNPVYQTLQQPSSLSGLKELALAATQGEWRLGPCGIAQQFDVYQNSGCFLGINAGSGAPDVLPPDFEIEHTANAAYIAAANPATILALIAQIEAKPMQAKQNKSLGQCPACFGTGEMTDRDENDIACLECNGTGEQAGWTDVGSGSMHCVPEACDKCKGTGKAQ